MTDTNITITADGTVDTGAALLKLDALVAAYTSILEQATAQLESLELSDDQLRKVSENARQRLDYYQIGVNVVQQMREPADDSSSDIAYVMKRITNAVACDVDAEHLKPIIERIVDKRLEDLKTSLLYGLDSKIDAAVMRRDAQIDSDARRCNRDMTDALKHLLGGTIDNAVIDGIRKHNDQIASPAAANESGSVS